MADELRDALASAGPHTPESLAERLPHFPVSVIRDALEALAAQGVLERLEIGSGPAYRYVAPERYAQADRDVIFDPGRTKRRTP